MCKLFPSRTGVFTFLFGLCLVLMLIIVSEAIKGGKGSSFMETKFYLCKHLIQERSLPFKGRLFFSNKGMGATSAEIINSWNLGISIYQTYFLSQILEFDTTIFSYQSPNTDT